MADLFEYKCPHCGGQLEFNSGEQQLKCPYCDSILDVEALSKRDSELEKAAPDKIDWDNEPGQEWAQGETNGMNVYVCQSCGGEIVCDETTAATKCPYCESPVVMKGKFSGDLKPDYIIPFKLDKKQAKERYFKHLEGKKFLPKIFKDKNHIDEIKGVYVPFWLFDSDIAAKINYETTRVRTWMDSENMYTETTHYDVFREGTISFEHVPVDGSRKMPDDLMQSIEPFDFKDAVEFKTAYLAGYMANRYDVESDESIETARARIKESTEDAFLQTVIGYSAILGKRSSINQLDGHTKYALYPVWILNTTYEGQKFTFAMNGQTGKMVGDLPMDKGAFWANFAKVGGITAVVLALIQLAISFI